MRREDYYRPNNNNSREDYQRDYQQQPQPSQPSYNNYNYGPQQPPYYPPRRHHHVFLWILVVILCIFLGWFAADHFLGGDQQAQQPSTTVNRSNTTNNKTINNKPQAPAAKQPNLNRIQNEMTKLGVNQKDQMAAFAYYEKQSTQDQKKIIKLIEFINTAIPSTAMRRQVLSWILHMAGTN